MTSTTSLPGWVEEAAALPLAFAQVREDALLDREVVERAGTGARVLLVASGGCTAAWLAACPAVRVLHLVDPNPAQLALARLKLSLLARPGAERRQLLGHEALPAETRSARLAVELERLGLAPDALGPPSFLAEVGPDHAGRYELLFAALRRELRDAARELERLLASSDPAAAAHAVDPGTALGQRLDRALDTVMALPNLVALFGAEATRNPVEPFARHFSRRIRHVFATLPAAENPYLWQMLLGRHPPGGAAPWLVASAPARSPRIEWSQSPMVAVLAGAREDFDVVHLSNILDWLAPEAAARTLELAERALRPGGLTLVRQLNSTLDVPVLAPQLEWLARDSEELHARDRSFFYRALHLGRKR